MNSAHLLPLFLLAACSSADPWRHFPTQSRPSPAVAPPQEAARTALPSEPRPPASATTPAPVAHGQRRAVPAQIVSMPPPPAPPPAVPAPSLPPVPAPAAIGPQAIIQCDALSCTTPEGRVQGGTGNVHLDAGGRPCHASGGWLQCF